MKNRDSYTFIDLFAGAGGLSEGLQKAGLVSLYASDIDELAIKTFKHNHPNVYSEVIDIHNINSNHIYNKSNVSEGGIDLVAGGPPCQGFSLAGPRLPDSPKNKLVLEFLRMVKTLRPKVFLFENVPGIVSMQKGAVVDALKD